MRTRFGLLLLFSIWISHQGFAQKEWAPIGAKWYINPYTDTNLEPILNDYYIIESTKDTIINDLSFRIVGDYLMHQVGEEIYYLNNDTLRLIYSFDAIPGDTLIFDMLTCFEQNISIPYVVKTLDSLFISADTLKRIGCEILPEFDSYSPQYYEYIEKIGSTRFLVENSANCFMIPGVRDQWLRCYEEEGLLYKTDQFLSYGSLNCDYIDPLITPEIKETTKLTVSPNPFHNLLKINCGNKSGLITIHTITGELVYSTPIRCSAKVDLSELPSNTYILSFLSESKEIYNKLIIRQ